jgi:hypothetical protein
VLTHPDQLQSYESFGSWVHMVDWDADGDLDLVIGGFGGELLLRINEGTREEPLFAVANQNIQVGGKDAVITEHHATPVVADWDGDGLWDILTGSEAGGVFWLRNTGRPGEPKFDAIENLIPVHTGTGYEEVINDDDAPTVGIRTQIGVTDYNRDGKLDLLVGDFVTNFVLRADLTAEERTEFELIRQRRQASAKVLRDSMDQLRAHFQEQYPAENGITEEADQAWTQAYETMKESAAYKQAREEYDNTEPLIRQFMQKAGAENSSSIAHGAFVHGRVWLFQQQ